MKKVALMIGSHKKSILLISLILIGVVCTWNSPLRADFVNSLFYSQVSPDGSTVMLATNSAKTLMIQADQGQGYDGSDAGIALRSSSDSLYSSAGAMEFYGYGHTMVRFDPVNDIESFYGEVKAISYGCLSDVRFKDSITPIKNSLEKICSLTGVTYQWKKNEFKDYRFNDRRQIGFIAQEVEKVFPELVSTDKEGYKSVDYDKFTAILVEGMKQLKSDNDALRKENETLKQKMASLEDMGARLERLEAMVESGNGKRVASK
jgi:hypothetical protein